MSSESLADRLQRRIAETGSLSVADYVNAALYDEIGGFYTTAGMAGRRGDFLTSPEVGPLFGAVVGQALDTWWRDAGWPASFVVQEWGAGPGTLGRSVIAAAPAVVTSGALSWAMVEASAAQRTMQPEGGAFRSLDPIEARKVADVDVIFANELLDNLPFDIAERTASGWNEILVTARDETGRFGLDVGKSLPAAAVVGFPDLPLGSRVPVQTAARDWIAASRAASPRVIIFDYGAETTVLAQRDGGWLRTHRAHDGGHHWLDEPGLCDITTDVDIDQIQRDQPAHEVSTQAEWLGAHGIAELVDEGRRIWHESAGIGDLAALKARSRIREAEALLDADGLGAFLVLEWSVPGRQRGIATPT